MLCRSARRILFSHPSDDQFRNELREMCQVDQAHLLMLAQQSIVPRSSVNRLLAAIERIKAEDFEALRRRESTRGLYFLYEDYLIETEGTQAGGILQTARSRNDLNATLLKRKLRRPYLCLLHQALRLDAVLLRRARKFAQVIMPAYTHGQAAMPITYGHYLAGVAQALLRDSDALFEAAKGMQSCPLGAGAVAGTSIPIDTALTARLLGFDSDPLNSVDAVASRDLVLRLLAAMAIYSLTLSRLASDLLQWTTAEFDFLHLPDELVGCSSAMPQKRNPFLLEHIQGRSASALGTFIQAAAATHAMPFTNSIAVGTEAAKSIWTAFQDLTEIVILMRLVIAGAQPNAQAMLERNVKGFTAATAFANRLMVEADIDFRRAHSLVGEAVLESLQSGNDFHQVLSSSLRDRGYSVSFAGLDLHSIVCSLEYGGGPGPSSLKNCLNNLCEQWAGQYRRKKSQDQFWQQADIRLNQSVQDFHASAQLEEASSLMG